MNAPDASLKITTYRTAELKKRRMETPTVTSVTRTTPLEVIQNQEQNQEKGTPEQLLDSRGYRQQQRADVAGWR